MFRRPCLAPGCPALACPGRSRCPDHESIRGRAKNARRSRLESGGARSRTRRLLNRQGVGRCARCRGVFAPRRLEVDHVLALEDGGRDEYSNVQTLCHRCHVEKTTEENAARRRR